MEISERETLGAYLKFNKIWNYVVLDLTMPVFNILFFFTMVYIPQAIPLNLSSLI